jgi:hypothetical protein
MRVMCSAVLGIEALVVLLATSLATSNGSVPNPALAWIVGILLIGLLITSIGTLGKSYGLTVGWIMQVLVLATSLIVGWSMLIVGLVFVVLWFVAIHTGRRVEALQAQESDPD